MKKEKIYVSLKETAQAAAVETAAAQTVETETQNNETAAEAETQTAPEAETTPTAAAAHTPEQAATTQTTPQPQIAETIEDVEKRLEIELDRLHHKKRLAMHRQKFIDSMGSLQLYIDMLKNENDFETQSGKITFKILNTDNYDRTNFMDTFTISNTELIRKFCNTLHSEMKQKKTELENQLLTA
jgi:hypothetical protein